MRSWITRNWRWALPVGAVLAAVGAWLVFGFFAFQTYFQDDEVDEALPFFTAGPAPSGMAGDETTEEMADAMNKAMDELDMPMTDEVDEPMPEMEGTPEAPEAEPAQTGDESIPKPGVPEPEAADAGDAEAEDTEGGSAAPEAEPEPEAEAPQPEAVEPQIIVEAAGTFIDRSHPTEGSARVLGDGSGQRFLRLEDFRTDNGPDLNVYLSAAPPDAPAGDFDNDFVDLGDLKGNVGAQNYEIPAGLDLAHYSTVAIWCVRFGVVFGAAELTAP